MTIDTSNLKVTKLVIEQTPATVKTTAPVSKTPATVKTTAPVSKTSATVKTTAPVNKTPATVKTTAPVAPKAQKDASLFWKIVAVLALLALIAFAIGSFIRTQAVSPTQDTGRTGSTANSAPASNPVSPSTSNETWKAVLTSANSNGNFIADLGGHGNGSVIPETAVDLQGKTWEIGRVLLTYCEDASTCFYAYGKPGDQLPRAFNVNSYTPSFAGDLEKELQYIDTGWNNNENVSWTYWTPVQ